MQILRNTAAPTGAAPMEGAESYYQQEIAAGRMMGVVIRHGQANETGHEVPVSLELGLRISRLVFDYVLEQHRLCADRLATLESRAALSVQEGGPAK